MNKFSVKKQHQDTFSSPVSIDLENIHIYSHKNIITKRYDRQWLQDYKKAVLHSVIVLPLVYVLCVLLLSF
jgi:hypothetical protein